jgi:hypothetical protein
MAAVDQAVAAGLHLLVIMEALVEVPEPEVVPDQVVAVGAQQCYRSTEFPKLWPMVAVVVEVPGYNLTEEPMA